MKPYKRLQTVTGPLGFVTFGKDLHAFGTPWRKVTKPYERLRNLTKGYETLRKVTKGYERLQNVTLRGEAVESTVSESTVFGALGGVVSVPPLALPTYSQVTSIRTRLFWAKG